MLKPMNFDIGHSSKGKGPRYKGQQIQGVLYNPYAMRRHLPAQFILGKCSPVFISVPKVLKTELKSLRGIKALGNAEILQEREMFFTEDSITSLLNRFEKIKSHYLNSIGVVFQEGRSKPSAIGIHNNRVAKEVLPLSDFPEFRDPYLRAGYYYTLKDYILFHNGVILDRFSGQEALEYLKSHANSLEDLQSIWETTSLTTCDSVQEYVAL